MLELSKKYLQKEEKDFSLEDLEKLQKLIKYHSDLYYNQQNPIISDYEYDLLFKKLQNLEKKFDIKDAETSKV
jgi:DNA ligase